MRGLHVEELMGNGELLTSDERRETFIEMLELHGIKTEMSQSFGGEPKLHVGYNSSYYGEMYHREGEFRFLLYVSGSSGGFRLTLSDTHLDRFEPTAQFIARGMGVAKQ